MHIGDVIYNVPKRPKKANVNYTSEKNNNNSQLHSTEIFREHISHRQSIQLNSKFSSQSQILSQA